MTKKKVDIIVLVFLLLLAINYPFIVEKTIMDIPVLSSYLFLIPPIIYLSMREKKDWIKILALVFVIGFIVGFPFTFLGELTNAWAIHVSKEKLFGVFYFPIVIAWMLMVALTVIFYQHFYINTQNLKKGLSKRFKKVTITLSVISFIVTLVCLYLPSFFTEKYSYLIIGSVNLIPFLVYSIKRPKYILRITQLMFYFFLIYLSIEFVGLNLNWWTFEGSYIGFVKLLGISFPIEEFVYWMILFSASIICCYESFFNTKVEK